LKTHASLHHIQKISDDPRIKRPSDSRYSSLQTPDQAHEGASQMLQQSALDHLFRRRISSQHQLLINNSLSTTRQNNKTFWIPLELWAFFKQSLQGGGASFHPARSWRLLSPWAKVVAKYKGHQHA
jgi:hypothetical protein